MNVGVGRAAVNGRADTGSVGLSQSKISWALSGDLAILKGYASSWVQSAKLAVKNPQAILTPEVIRAEEDLLLNPSAGGISILKRALIGAMESELGSAAALALKREFNSLLARMDWKLHSNKIDSEGVCYSSMLIPLNAEAVRWSSFAGNFSKYGLSGVASQEMKLPATAAPFPGRLCNGWITEVCSDREILLSGIRSGTFDRHGEPNKNERERANRATIEDFFQAAAVHQVKRLGYRESWKIVNPYQPGYGPVEIKLLSLDLQSPGFTNPGSAYRLEVDTVKAQRQLILGLSKRGAVTLKYSPNLEGAAELGSSDCTVSLPIKVRPLSVNLPNLSREFVGRYGGDSESSTLNKKAIGTLVEDALSFVRRDPKRKVAQEVAILIDQVKELFESGRYKTLASDPCALSARLALLGYKIGYVVHFNCRSGKDRTGLLDAEIKLLATELARGTLPQPGAPLNERQSKALFDFAVLGGNAYVQLLNTGVEGNRMRSISECQAPFRPTLSDPLVARFGSLQRWEAFRGLSELTSV